MKKLNEFIITFQTCLGTIGYSSSVFSQTPFVQAILDKIGMDSVLFSVKQLTGEVSVIIDTIKSRHIGFLDNELAFKYAKQRFLNYNLQVDSLTNISFKISSNEEFPCNNIS